MFPGIPARDMGSVKPWGWEEMRGFWFRTELPRLRSVLPPLQRALVETHLRQICGLQQQLRQQQGGGDSTFHSLSPPIAPADPDLDLHYLALRGGPGLGHGEISLRA